MKTLLRAPYIYPVDRPLLRDAAIVFDTTQILAVGPSPQLQYAHPDAQILDLPHHILLPSFINPHTHLELSSCSPSSFILYPSSFPDWLLSIPQRTNPANLPPESYIPTATQLGISQSLRFGVSAVGDISQFSHLTRPILANSPLRAISFGEVLGLARRLHRIEELLPRALQPFPPPSPSSFILHPSSFLSIGLSPHSPYTTDLPTYQRCLQLARAQNLPLATHLAESPDEQSFLQHHAGPFRDLWDSLNQWSDPVETFPGSPIRFAHAIGLLSYPTLLAHVNYCPDDELPLLAAGQASVVYCPRTHAYFNHPPHRFQDMLAAGINVAVGTDSCASSPDLNPLADLRLLHHLYPDLPPESLYPLITQNAARALQLHNRLGSLTPTKSPDLVAFPITTASPLLELLESHTLPTHLWIQGIPIPLE